MRLKADSLLSLTMEKNGSPRKRLGCHFFPSLVTKDYLPSTSYFVFLKLPDEEFLTSQFPDCFDKIVIGIDNWEVMIGILVCSCTLF